MRRATRRALPTLIGFLVVFGGFPLAAPQPVAAVSPDLVISQVYGGGGNSGATYTHDFIELFNRGSSAASLNGLSLQYASATGTGSFGSSAGQLTELPNISLAPGQYALVQEGGGTTGAPMPPADVFDSSPILMGAPAGKVALVTGTAGLGCNGGSTPCSSAQLSRIVDLVGYGSANFFEGSAAAPAPGNTTAVFRAQDGCQDTDDNAADFAVATPDPRNTSTTLSPCPTGDPAPEVSSTAPADDATGVAVAANLTIEFSEAVDVAAGWFTISCTTSGSHSAVVSGGPTSFTLDPDTDFAELDECDVTVHAAQVSDQDGADPPDTMAADFTLSFTTEGNVCSLSYTPIYDIQGSGMSAATTGNLSTQGVVVGDFEGPSATGIQGFYIQDATGDGDTATADGIFIYTANTNNGLLPGDLVRVTGYARERFGQTAMNGANNDFAAVTDIVGCGTATQPAAVEVMLPVANIDDLERFEGMLVRFPQELVIAEYFNYDRFNEMVLALPLAGENRPFTPTLLEEPGSAGYLARLSANLRSRITLDDARSGSNPASLRHPNGDPFSLTNRFRGGDLVADATGVLGYDFNLYRIQPTAPAEYTAVNPPPASPASVGGRIQVAAMNTLNYFLTADAIQDDPPATNNPADDVCGGNANLECRGHDSNQPAELGRQRAKLLAAISGLGAEVIGLNEIENTPGVDPLADIVAGLNALEGAGTYAYIDTGVIGTDAIRVGLLYKPAAVEPMGTFQILDSTDDPRFDDGRSRPVLAQTFVEKATGALFTVAVNHLKSKGSACSGDPDLNDGQGNCNVTRTRAAQALVDWLATDPTGSGDPDFLIIGDLNSYAMEDPIDAVQAGADDTAGTGDDYTNLIRRHGGAHAYSYVFDGMAGYLDHALATSSLTVQVTGATEWHINADEPDILDYDTSFKPTAQDLLYEPNAFRSSDHDPVLLGLNLATATGKVTGNGTWADGAFDMAVQFLPGASAPSGSTTLSVEGGTLTASSFDWLVVSGDRATYQGEGALDGVDGYGFLVSVLDGGSPGTKDRIRVRIWESDGDTVYDSQPGAPVDGLPTTPLTSGNVTVHKAK